MPPAAATAAARRSIARPVRPDSSSESVIKRANQARHTAHTARAPRRVATVEAPARPTPQRPRTAPARPRTAPHTAPAPRRPRTATPAPRPIRVERRPPRSLRVERHAPRVGLSIRLPSGGKLLDRIVRGRAWIPVLGVLLVGIVGMRVEVLKLGSSVGTEMQQASQLQSANAVMLKQVSALSNNTRIEQLAEKRGMVMPGPLDMHFVQAAGAANVNRAIANIREPAPAIFLASVRTERAQDPVSAAAAANRSAVGVLGGGILSSAGTSASITGATGQIATTPALAPTSTASNTTAVTGTSATETYPSSSTAATQGTGSSATAPSSSSTTAGTAGATNNVPPVTSTASNGAASLAG